MTAKHLLLLGAFAAAAPASAAADTEVKGVNPADILNRADLIVKAVNLPTGESLVGVLKFDKRLGAGFGGNVELPVASYVNVGAADDFGVGDLFARVRYVRPLSARVIGLVSLEGVAPLADGPLLGTGKWQLNPAGGFVYLWSQKAFTAVIYKHSFSIAGKDSRPDIDVNQVRALQTFLLKRGYYLTVDARHEWQSRGPNEQWTTTELELGRQFSARWAGSIRIGKTYGDRKNDGAIEVNVRTFF